MIQIEHLSKSFRVATRKGGLKASLRAFVHREYRDIQALDDISLHINAGEIVGYIGPNGAGKSTTIKIMSGILVPDSGLCTVNGIDPFKDRKEHAKNIGVVFGQRTQLWWDIPVMDSFELLKEIYKIDTDAFYPWLHELISLFSLEKIVEIPVRQLSLGQRMKCDIVAALLHKPKVLFLDEPTIGLDASSKIMLRSLIKEINQRYKTTVILTTHDMQDIESLAKRVILIGNGRILFDGSLDLLSAQHESLTRVLLEYKGTLYESIHYDIETSTDTTATLKVKSSLAEALNVLSQTLAIHNIEVEKADIDALILQVYEDYQI